MTTLQERVHAAPKPDEWKLDKLHQVFRVRRGKKNAGMKEDNLLSLSYGRIIQKDIETADGLLPENFEGYQIVEPGNIVLRLTDLQNDKRSLRQGLTTQRGIITSAYDAVEVQRDNDPRFWFYSLLALDLAKHYYSLGGGVRQSVKFADFPNDWVYRPDLPTQRTIADFLDRETARIDSLIEKKQRLVELLREKKTNELENLLFDSGFEIRKLRHEARVISKGTTPSTIGAEMVLKGIRFLKAENVTWNGVSTSPQNFISQETHRELKRSALKSDDVLVVIAGATTGKTAVMPAELTPANTNQAVSFVRLRKLRYAEIVCAAIGCPRVKRDILVNSVQSAQPNLSMEDLGNLVLPFPDEEEISGVLDQVSAIKSRTTNLITVIETSINRLKEYRSALITSAVTGQIDVSTYARSETTDRQLDSIQSEMQA